ncbi:hypothetical protein JOM56_005623 [Amanita muscaria]
MLIKVSPKGVRMAWSLTSSPIHRLPDEVLSHIFHLCLHDDFDESNDQHLSPRIFTKICKRWTHVALTNKSLWSNVTMSLPLTPAQFIETNIRLLRSRPHPIDIHLDFRDPLWDWDEETHSFGVTEMSTVIRTLLPHVDRWHKLIVLTDTWAPIFCLLLTIGCVADSAPVLSTISLSRCNAYFAAKGETFTPKCLEAPIKLFGGIHLERLRHLSLVGVHVDWTGSYLADLQQLELKYHASNVMPSIDQFVRILDSCPRLKTLSIIGWGPRLGVAAESNGHGDKVPHGQHSRSTEVIGLECLTRFAFGFVDVEYAVGLLSLFRFPALQRLELEDVSSTINPFEERDCSAILKFVTGNRPCNDTEENEAQRLPLDRITSLELRGICASFDTFVAFFGCAMNLEHLILNQTNEEAIRSLGAPTDGSDIPGIVCPCLRTLHCQNVDEEVIGNTVATRHVAGGRKLDVVIVEQNG